MLVALGALSGCSLTGKEFEDKLNHNIVYLQTHAHLYTHTGIILNYLRTHFTAYI